MAEQLKFLSIISFVVAVAFLILAFALWFVFKIPNVIGDLSGRTARKSIEKLRFANEQSGLKAYQSSAENIGRGQVTASSNPVVVDYRANANRPETGLLSNNRADNTNSEATGLLIENQLQQPGGNYEVGSNYRAANVNNNRMRIIEEIIIIHTDEVIE